MSIGTVNQAPLYACATCRPGDYWPEEDLRAYDGKCWCERCWGERVFKAFSPLRWSDLPRFVPEHEVRIAELEAQVKQAGAEALEKMAKRLEERASAYAGAPGAHNHGAHGAFNHAANMVEEEARRLRDGGGA